MDSKKQKTTGKAVKASSKSAQKTRRGRRIPQTAWPGILQQYQRGATLTKIAEDFDCTPSAISYIVKKAETIYGDLTGSDHLPTPTRLTTGSISNPSQLRPRDDTAPSAAPATTTASKPVDEMEARLQADAAALVAAYRDWKQAEEGESNTDAAMTMMGQLHNMRRSLAKLEINLSKQGVATHTSSTPRPTSRSRYATGWQAN